jgi:hypothetical protein
MIFSQLAYGLIILTYFGDGTPVFYSDPPSPMINAGSFIELAEGINERSAAVSTKYDYGIGGFRPMPFTYTDASYTNCGLVSLYDNFAYGPTNGTFKSWSFNAFTYDVSFDGRGKFIPFQGSRASSYFVRSMVYAIDRIASKYVQSYTTSNITFWTASNLWVAAGGKPSFATSAFIFESYKPVTTGHLWQVYRALTNMHTTQAIYCTATGNTETAISGTNSDSYHYSITAHVEPPDYPTEPTWEHVATVVSNMTALGFAVDYSSATVTNINGAGASHLEEITFNTFSGWSGSYDEGSVPPDYVYNFDASNRTHTAGRYTQHYNCPLPNLAAGAVATIDFRWGVNVYMYSISPGSPFLSNLGNASGWSTNLTASTTFTGVDTNWAPNLTFDVAAPEISTLMDLTPYAATGFGSYVYFEVIERSLPRVINWTFTRCHP